MINAVSLEEVLARPDVWRGGLARAGVPAVSTGFAALDAELPGGGWPRGTLTDILLEHSGVGECSLLIPALLRLQEAKQPSLLVAPPHRLHGPAWASRAIDLSLLFMVSPTRSSTRQRDVLWAAEQALSSGALGAVVLWAAQIDARQVRRLEVAAAGSHTLAFLLRGSRAGSESSPATLRLLLSAGAHGRLAVNVLKRRGPPCARTLQLDVPRPLEWRKDDETGPALARPAFPLPAARSLRPALVA